MGQYREKECPHCGTLHRKKGPYCSRSCGNHRTYTPAQKAHKSKKQTEFLTSDSPVAEQSRWIISEIGKFARNAKQDPINHEKKWDDYNVIPTKPLEGNQFVADNAIWTVKDEPN